MWYAIVTFGSDPIRYRRVHADHAAAVAVAARLRQRGRASCVRVIRCESRALARTADIGVLRRGESIVWQG